MFLLDASLAQSIVDRAMQILRTNVNVMDERGLIIASGDRARIGSRHEGALLVLAQGRAVEVDAAVAQRLHDTRPGINLPLRAEGRVVGVVGLSGEPDAVRQQAELVRLAAETMLEQAQWMQMLARDQRLREELVLQLIGVSPPGAGLDDWASRLGVDLARPCVALLIEIADASLAADAVLAAQQRLRRLLAEQEPGLACAPVTLRELAVLMPLPAAEPDLRSRSRPCTDAWAARAAGSHVLPSVAVSVATMAWLVPGSPRAPRCRPGDAIARRRRSTATTNSPCRCCSQAWARAGGPTSCVARCGASRSKTATASCAARWRRGSRTT